SSHVPPWSSRVAFVDQIDDLVGPGIDDADLVTHDEVAVATIVREEPDHLARHGEQVHRARDPVSHVIVEVDIRRPSMFEVESTMQALAILQAQSGPFLLDLLAALTEIAPIGPITLLHPSLFLRRPRLGRAFALRIAF